MLRRTSTLAAAFAATLTLSAGLAAPAQAAPSGDAASWLQGELGQDRLFTTTFDGTHYVDHGLTIDAGLAFAELGRRTPVRQMRDALAPHMGDYASFGANAVAKGLVWAQTSGADPQAYGGIDWVTSLEERTDDTSGRISDGGESDYANTIGQALAVQGLWKAGSTERSTALGHLLAQQCAAGFFRLSMGAEGSACGRGAAASTDVTALAVLALDTLPRRNAAARKSMGRAVRWLKGRQSASGAFGSDPSITTANANSTGLAARAMAARGACRPARAAARWVRTVQVRGTVRRTPYAGELGAVAYDKKAYRVGKRRGITAATRDQFRRTTAQAAPALRHLRGC